MVHVFLKKEKLGHFALLFCRGRLRNVQRFITHVHSHCSAHFINLLFGGILVAVSVVVYLSSLFPVMKQRKEELCMLLRCVVSCRFFRVKGVSSELVRQDSSWQALVGRHVEANIKRRKPVTYLYKPFHPSYSYSR